MVCLLPVSMIKTQKKHTIMKQVLTKMILSAVILIFSQSCKKENNPVIAPDILFKTLDSTLQYNKHVTLDVNSDGVTDFYFSEVLIVENNIGHLLFYANGSSQQGCRIMVQSQPEVILGGLWAKPIDSATVISETIITGSHWNNFLEKSLMLDITEDAAYQKNYHGLWLNKKNYYLAIKPVINGKTHYGWVRISHTTGEEKLTIHDFAYNKIPGQGIKAGQKN